MQQLTAQQLAAIRVECDVYAFDWAQAVKGDSPKNINPQLAIATLRDAITLIVGNEAISTLATFELVEYEGVSSESLGDWFGRFVVRIEFSNGQTLLVGDTDEPIDDLH